VYVKGEKQKSSNTEEVKLNSDNEFQFNCNVYLTQLCSCDCQNR